jgi:predicted Zn-dependent protease
MSGSLFYKAGQITGRKFAKSIWLWQAMSGNKRKSQRAEYLVGKEIHKKVTAELGDIKPSRERDLIIQTGGQLASVLKEREYPFTFELLENHKVNAFAVPGGFVFVNIGVVKFCDYQPDKIAFVLAHEIAHIVKGHALERVIGDMAASAALKTGKISSAAGAWIRKTGIKFLQSSYSRNQEDQADTFAVRLMTAAGFDNQKAIEFLQKLADSAENRNDFEIGKYFSTHPQLNRRIENVRKTTARQNNN